MSTNKAEQAVALATLILADESVAITPEKLQALLRAAGIEDVEPIWTTLFANALKDKNVTDILTTIAATEPAIGGEKPGSENTNDRNDGVPSLEGKEDDGIDIDADSDSDIGMGLFD